MVHDLIVVGGGAAGFFTAIQYAERLPGKQVLILESSNKLLSKVAISGGGRCNVTHACFDPKEMVGYYPRGDKELLGPFHKFLCGDMMAWLDERGVEVKIEDDGRVFPVSDNSQTIIDLFLGLCEKYNIRILTTHRVEHLESARSLWSVKTNHDNYSARQVMWATGSSPAAWKLLERMGHRIVPPVPSLFTFNIPDKDLKKLAGISVSNASVMVDEMRMEETGPLLITHWGMSGPAILKLSSRGARLLHTINYRFDILVNWTGVTRKEADGWIIAKRQSDGGKQVVNTLPEGIPKRLWGFLVKRAGVEDRKWGELTKDQIGSLALEMVESRFQVDGKSTFKEEFVTAGGVDTIEVNFTTMESRKFNGLYLAGEVLNIDALTGGFNFQAAWTEAYIAAQSMT